MLKRQRDIVSIVAAGATHRIPPPQGPVAVPSGHCFLPGLKTAAGNFGVARIPADYAGQHTDSSTIPTSATAASVWLRVQTKNPFRYGFRPG
jgi:hypothetical protein